MDKVAVLVFLWGLDGEPLNIFCIPQRCIQSASLRPGTHSFFFWTQRILNEGSNWTQKKKIECLCK